MDSELAAKPASPHGGASDGLQGAAHTNVHVHAHVVDRFDLILIALVALVFGRTLVFGFVDWDDLDYIRREPLVRNPLADGWRTLLLTPSLGYPVLSAATAANAIALIALGYLGVWVWRHRAVPGRALLVFGALAFLPASGLFALRRGPADSYLYATSLALAAAVAAGLVALEREVRPRTVLLNLGVGYSKLGRHEDAVRAYARALTAGPPDAAIARRFLAAYRRAPLPELAELRARAQAIARRR